MYMQLDLANNGLALITAHTWTELQGFQFTYCLALNPLTLDPESPLVKIPALFTNLHQFFSRYQWKEEQLLKHFETKTDLNWLN